MDNDNSPGLFDLIRFDREVLRPRVSHYGALDQNSANSRYVLSELLEGYLWLELGVDLGAYPLKEARLLVSQRYSHLSDDIVNF